MIENVKVQNQRLIWLISILILVTALLAYKTWKMRFPSYYFHLPKAHHVSDYAGILPKQDLPRFEYCMDLIMQEANIDVRFIFVNGTGGKTIEQLAVDLVKELRIGGKTGKEHGLLLLYDTESKRLKVEVGYGLEEFFPDSFVGYLVNRHARLFFESGDKSLGLRWLLRILQYRIRNAVLGKAFDPHVLNKLSYTGNLSGGAGASAILQTVSAPETSSKPQLSEIEREQYVPQNSPAETYNLYLEWLSQPICDPNVDLFTEGSCRYMSGLLWTPAYLDFILLGECGQNFQIIERQNLAILYFTSTPLVSPHFFIKENNKWRIDILAEVQNTKESTGGVYSWTYMSNNNPYSQTFTDLLINIKGYLRFKDGDNRALAIRGSKNL